MEKVTIPSQKYWSPYVLRQEAILCRILHRMYMQNNQKELLLNGSLDVIECMTQSASRVRTEMEEMEQSFTKKLNSFVHGMRKLEALYAAQVKEQQAIISDLRRIVDACLTSFRASRTFYARQDRFLLHEHSDSRRATEFARYPIIA
jgi:hypothetical protein